MTNKALQQITAKTEPKETQTLTQTLERMRPQIEAALPTQIGAERFTRLVLTEIRRTPKLLECNPQSVLAAMMLCAQLGVEPGPLGHAYLVPYGRECTFILGYRGMIDLASRSGRLRSVVARTVYQGDNFDFAFGIADKLRHVPCAPSERGEPIAYYGIARFANPSGYFLHVMYPPEIEAAKKRSASAKRQGGPWDTDYDAMARKTVIRRMAPYLPLSTILGRAIEADERVISDLDDTGIEFAEDTQATEGKVI